MRMKQIGEVSMTPIETLYRSVCSYVELALGGGYRSNPELVKGYLNLNVAGNPLATTYNCLVDKTNDVLMSYEIRDILSTADCTSIYIFQVYHGESFPSVYEAWFYTKSLSGNGYRWRAVTFSYRDENQAAPDSLLSRVKETVTAEMVFAARQKHDDEKAYQERNACA